MGLYDGPNAMACERRCREDVFRDALRGRMEGGETEGVEPARTRAETAGAAVAVVETGVARSGIGARVLAALSRLWSCNSSGR